MKRHARSIRPTPRAIAQAAGALALAFVPFQALAVPIAPGGASTLPGTSGPPGTVIRDALVPFEIRNAGGAVVMRGNVQDRVVRTATGALIFEPRIRDITGTSAFGIIRVVRRGLDDFFTDVDYQPGGLGFSVPTFCSRSGDGDTLDYSFAFAPIFTGGSSKFFYAITDADQFALNGRMTIQLEDGTSTTIAVAAPVIDTTPPQVRLTSPSPESCVCPDALGMVTFSGLACDDESDLSYRVRVRRSSGADGTGWTELTPATTERCTVGTLAQWNATGQPDGDYIVELEAVNQVGLVSTAALEFRLNTAVSPASIRTPADGEIVGGTTCLDGTIGEDCFSTYRVDYRPTTGGAFLPVDTASPLYTTRVINDPIASWNTRTVLDGDYQVRVRVSDICGNNADHTRTYEVDNTAPIASIQTPAACEWIGGVVEVKGQVFDRNIASWVLEYTGGDERGWRTIATGTTNIPAGGAIGTWDTSSLPRCAYTLRLRATDKARVGCVAPSGNTTHDMASVNVGCRADINGDGSLDIFDFLEFSNLFALGCP